MKATDIELQIQGGHPCDYCGEHEPCGNIYDCAFWSSGPKERSQPEPSECDRYGCRYIEVEDNIQRCGNCGEYK